MLDAVAGYISAPASPETLRLALDKADRRNAGTNIGGTNMAGTK
jgi:hypothetical protein